MTGTLWEIVYWVVLALLLVANAFGVFLVVMQMPGTWLILILTALMACWQPNGQGAFSWITLVLLLILAILGEIIETAAGAAGAKKAGGSNKGMWLSLVGGIAGAILGTIYLIFLPILGTIIGTCIGAALGSMAGDKWEGRTWDEAVAAGKGAAKGKLWGTIGKIAIAMLMWVITAIAVFWP